MVCEGGGGVLAVFGCFWGVVLVVFVVVGLFHAVIAFNPRSSLIEIRNFPQN